MRVAAPGITARVAARGLQQGSPPGIGRVSTRLSPHVSFAKFLAYAKETWGAVSSRSSKMGGSVLADGSVESASGRLGSVGGGLKLDRLCGLRGEMFVPRVSYIA